MYSPRSGHIIQLFFLWNAVSLMVLYSPGTFYYSCSITVEYIGPGVYSLHLHNHCSYYSAITVVERPSRMSQIVTVHSPLELVYILHGYFSDKYCNRRIGGRPMQIRNTISNIDSPQK